MGGWQNKYCNTPICATHTCKFKLLEGRVTCIKAVVLMIPGTPRFQDSYVPVLQGHLFVSKGWQQHDPVANMTNEHSDQQDTAPFYILTATENLDG